MLHATPRSRIDSRKVIAGPEKEPEERSGFLEWWLEAPRWKYLCVLRAFAVKVGPNPYTSDRENHTIPTSADSSDTDNAPLISRLTMSRS